MEIMKWGNMLTGKVKNLSNDDFEINCVSFSDIARSLKIKYSILSSFSVTIET